MPEPVLVLWAVVCFKVTTVTKTRNANVVSPTGKPSYLKRGEVMPAHSEEVEKGRKTVILDRGVSRWHGDAHETAVWTGETQTWM